MHAHRVSDFDWFVNAGCSTRTLTTFNQLATPLLWSYYTHKHTHTLTHTHTHTYI